MHMQCTRSSEDAGSDRLCGLLWDAVRHRDRPPNRGSSVRASRGNEEPTYPARLRSASSRPGDVRHYELGSLIHRVSGPTPSVGPASPSLDGKPVTRCGTHHSTSSRRFSAVAASMRSPARRRGTHPRATTPQHRGRPSAPGSAEHLTPPHALVSRRLGLPSTARPRSRTRPHPGARRVAGRPRRDGRGPRAASRSWSSPDVSGC